MTTSGVLLLNSSFIILSNISEERAFALIATNRAWTFESIPGKVVHSPSLTFAWPVSIVLNRWVDVPYMAPKVSDIYASRMGVLRRDNFTCGYCGGPGDTIDHIWPQSKGGEDTWENLIAACKPCNAKKGHMTPEDAEKVYGMKLLWPPRTPNKGFNFAKAQERINKLLLTESGIKVDDEA